MVLEIIQVQGPIELTITQQPFVTSATITWAPGELQWNTLLKDCSSHRGALLCHYHICSLSTGSRDNSSTRSQRVFITRQPFVTSATITWYPGELQWNTLLIDCSSHRGAHFSHWDMCSISNGSRDNSSTRSHRVNHHSTANCYISHYNLRSRGITVKYSINRLFLSSRRTLETLTYLFHLKWFSR